jgi:hypothetical protein
MRRLAAVTVVALTVGASTLAAVENPQPGLEVSQMGSAVAIQTALVVDQGAGSVKLFFSSATPSCAEILASSRRLASGEVSFELTGNTSSDGETRWMVYYAGFTTNAPEGTEIEVDQLDPAVGAKSAGRVKALLEGARDGDTLQVDGTFEAIGCGGK